MRPYGYRAGKSHPLILYIHGVPHWNYGNVFFPEMQLLAGQGYWVLLVNPRGSTGYGHGFTFATRGRWGMEDYQDLMKAVDVAIARGGVDTTRLGVAGGSYGGVIRDRKSTPLNSSHSQKSDAVFCFEKKKNRARVLRSP